MPVDATRNIPIALQELLDEEPIRLMRCCHGVDRCEEEMIRGAYWPKATDEHGTFDGPAAEYIEMLMPMLRSMEATSHVLGNIWIVLGGERARIETDMTPYHRARSSAGILPDSVIAGRNLDRIEKRSGEWRILTRAVPPALAGSNI
jgi:SnoaL-like domain